MPKTKFQDFIFTIIMVIVMVYAMVCYNIAFDKGGMSSDIFLLASCTSFLLWVLSALCLNFSLWASFPKR